METKRLVAVVGPTASGKTDLAILLAVHYSAPILSVDSRQVYRNMAVGTAQPTAAQLEQAEHHFIACRAFTEEYSCGRFEADALALLDRLFRQHDLVIAVGGSGLYMQALCEGMDELPEVDSRLRETLNERLRAEGLPALAEQLRTLDPTYYEAVDRNNPARVVRALEVCLQSGQPYSAFRRGKRAARNFDVVKVGIDLPRAVLYERIDRRVDAMMDAGLESEARALYPFRAQNALQTVGYKELFAWFDGACTRAEAVAMIKRNTRRYAKRQLTWFRRDEAVHWFGPDDLEAMINYIDFGK